MIPTGGPPSDFLRSFLQLARSPGSWAWMIGILVLEVLVVLLGGPGQQPAWSWYEWLGLSRMGILSGKFWQFISYGFLHGDFIHAGVNAVFILLVGSRVEHIAGCGVLTKGLLFGVLGGAVGHLALNSGNVNDTLLVGMSGGCIALLLLLTTLSPQSRMMPLPVTGKSLGLGILVAELVLALMDPALAVPGFSVLGTWLVQHGMGHWFRIGHACHFGGGLAGWIYGRWLLRPRVSLKQLERSRARRETRDTGTGG